MLVLGVIAFHRDIGRLDMERPRDFAGAPQQLEPLVAFHRAAVEGVQAEQEDAVVDDVTLLHQSFLHGTARRSSARTTTANTAYAISAVAAAALSLAGGGPKNTYAWIASMTTPNASIAVRRAVCRR